MRVVLIRHAQASVQGPDYDQLSSHGYEQAVLLGKHLRTLPWHPSVVCVGPKLRHRQTWETLAMQGNTWPSATHHEALDELPAEWVMAAAMPLLAQQGHPVMSEAQALMGGKISVEAIQKLMSGAPVSSSTSCSAASHLFIARITRRYTDRSDRKRYSGKGRT